MNILKIFTKHTILSTAFFFIIDFLTKLWILAQTPFPLSLYGNYKHLYPSYFPISKPLPFFNIVLVWNNGVSFSMFSSHTLLGKIFLIILSLGITTYIISLLRKETNTINRFSLILIISGAIGNIFDRIRYGAVIDFLDFYIGTYHWPAFNFADICICIGVSLIFITTIFFKQKNK